MSRPTISFSCECGAKLTAKPSDKDRTSRCPKCKVAIHIPASLDDFDPRLSKATAEDIVGEFDNREIGAILITFDQSALDEDEIYLANLKLSINHTYSAGLDEIKSIIIRLAGALLDENTVADVANNLSDRRSSQGGITPQTDQKL